MTDNLWTKGPWAVYERPSPKRLTDPQAGSFIHCGPDASDDTGYSLIARAYTRDGLNERQANARLMASAPELAEALEALVASLSVNDEDGLTEFAEPMVAARAAIAAARGEKA